ncbi:TetR/AcrR family transcriptional regulator C-terminal domain-containing protein [Microbacterium sp. NPDC006705]|uniref:Transcriptional regulator, TetR family protein n=1 Tax=Microbacterium imperiale TaxID=33884 RepID=A0A9W6HFJ8_9MICO|nr:MULTISPECIES: TetR/AcrR family transcriptional regulator C-terminal domain-containing protein [Microbacterium]MCZ4069113.1 TetR/AcrR family transcriptional regulator C-terminal domain-containing protein [Microbacterium sp. H37-C3]WHE36205.1 TetR/AcrR family transcriptional regulator C-terminal domain-containing protein [Microbacterium sp. BDGP8]GLJ79609.1 putative transcriptional regulator, TetR family protein [Microbacterium imperiale]
MSKQSDLSPPPKLGRDVIVEAALVIVDQAGPSALSMRALGQRLGVEAMALYRHVHGKEDLLEGVVASLMTGLTETMRTEASEHWQAFLQNVAHAVRGIAVEHPRAFPLIATRHPAAPWLRPPLRSVEVVDTFLSTLIAQGFTDAQAVSAYRAFSSFLLGQLLLETTVRGAQFSPADIALDEGDADVPNKDGQLSLDSAPEVLRLRPLLSEDRSKEEFEVALELLLDRLDRELSQ